MHPPFDMQYTVDKEIEYEIFFIQAVCGSLLFCDVRADDNLAAFLPDNVGENVRHVRFAAELLV